MDVEEAPAPQAMDVDDIEEAAAAATPGAATQPDPFDEQVEQAMHDSELFCHVQQFLSLNNVFFD